jgi:tetratricopeptide (TPR) repeat protein
LYEKTGDIEKAKTYSEKAVNMYPEIQYFDQLGKLYFNDAEFEKATEVYLKALKSFPGDELFRKNFSLSLGKIENEKIKNKLSDEALLVLV